MSFNSKYKLGEIVFLITDADQLSRIITSVSFTMDGGIMYCLACGTNETKHYEEEIATTQNIKIKYGITEEI